MLGNKLIRHRNVREQINTIKNLGTKLKYDIETKYAVYPFIYYTYLKKLLKKVVPPLV